MADVIAWKDPKVSGAILGALTMLYVLFEKSGYTLISILAYTKLLAVVGCFVYANAMSVMGKPAPTVPKLEVSEESLKGLAVAAASAINAASAVAYRLALGQDIVLTAKAVAALYVVGKVGAWFHVLTLVYLVCFAALTVPKGADCVYAKYHAEIDAFAVKANEAVGEGVSALKAKVGGLLASQTKKSE